MHPALGDVDGDGLIDVLVTDLKYGALYRNKGDGLFEDITQKSGVAAAFNGKGGWAAILFDYDNDGDLDIFSANGAAEVLKEQFPLLLKNDGSGHFTDAAAEAGPYFYQKRSGSGAAACADDQAGALHLVMTRAVQVSPGE